MRHEGGMSRFSVTLEPEWLYTEGLKQNLLGAVIEKEGLHYNESKDFQPGIKRDYHAETREMIAGEIFRRVHPEGKTMGEYLREDFGPTYGLDGIIIGMKKEEIAARK